MKKILGFAMIIAMMLCFVGCAPTTGGDDKTQGEDKTITLDDIKGTWRSEDELDDNYYILEIDDTKVVARTLKKSDDSLVSEYNYVIFSEYTINYDGNTIMLTGNGEFEPFFKLISENELDIGRVYTRVSEDSQEKTITLADIKGTWRSEDELDDNYYILEIDDTKVVARTLKKSDDSLVSEYNYVIFSEYTMNYDGNTITLTGNGEFEPFFTLISENELDIGRVYTRF